MVVLVAGRQYRDRRGGDGAAVFARDHLGHGLLVTQGGGMQQRLADTVADRGMQARAAARVLVHGFSLCLEGSDVTPAQGIGDLAAHIVDMVTRVESRIASRYTGKDHVGAVAKCNLAVFQYQHDRNDRRRFNDAGEPRRHRLAFVEAAIGNRGARFNRRQVAMHITRPARRANYLFDFHTATLIFLSTCNVSSAQALVNYGTGQQDRDESRLKIGCADCRLQLSLRVR